MAIGSGFLPPVVVRLVAETGQFTADMTKASGEMATFGEKATASAAKGSAAWDAVGKYAAAGAAIVGVASVKMASDFEAAMLRVQTNAGASAAEVKKMTQSILDLAPTLGESPKALADALFFIESSGMSGAKALDVLTNSAKLARIGNADLTETTKALTSVMESGITGFKDAGEAAAIMNSIVGQGKMTMNDLSDAMGSGILSVAANFGISLQSVGAALDVLTVRGEPATQAATRLRAAIALMAAPSKQAAGILSELGLSTNEAAAAQNTMVKALEGAGVNFTRLADDMRQPNGIYVAIKDLQDQMSKAGLTSTQQAAVISRAFGGLRSATGIQTLNVDLDALAADFTRVGAGASQFGANWDATTKTTKQQMAELTAQIDVFLIRLGNFLIPKLTEGAHWLSEHKRLATDLAEVVGGVLVAALARYIAMQALAFTRSVIGMITATTEAVSSLAVSFDIAATAEAGSGAALLGVSGATWGTLGAAAALTGGLLYLSRTADAHVGVLKRVDETTVSWERHIPLVGGALAALDSKVLGLGDHLNNLHAPPPIVVDVDTYQARLSVAQLQAQLNQLNAASNSAGPGGGNQAAANAVQSQVNDYGVYGSAHEADAAGGIIGRAMAAGGQITKAAAGYTSGFMTAGPTLVGEGNPAWPEFVVATDPQYHARNVDLWMKAGKGLGMFATGRGSSAGGTDISPVGGVTININGNITLPNVTDGRGFFESVQAEALRYQRANGTTGIRT